MAFVVNGYMYEIFWGFRENMKFCKKNKKKNGKMRKLIKSLFNTVMLKLIIPGDQPMFRRGERIGIVINYRVKVCFNAKDREDEVSFALSDIRL